MQIRYIILKIVHVRIVSSLKQPDRNLSEVYGMFSTYSSLLNESAPICCQCDSCELTQSCPPLVLYG